MRSKFRDGATSKLLSLINGYRRWIVLAVMLTLSSSLIGMAQPLVVRRLVDAPSGLDLGLLALLGGLFAGQALVGAVGQFILQRTGERVVFGVRLRMVRRLLGLRMDVYDRHRIGDLLSRTTTDTTAARTSITEGAANLITGVIGLAGAVALMVWLDWLLFTVVVTIVAVAASVVSVVFARIRHASLDMQNALGMLTSDLERALTAIRTVRASQAEDRETARIGGTARAIYASSLRLARLRSISGPAMSLAVNGS